MPEFNYRAKLASGQTTDGVIAAGSHREALALLTRQSLFPLEVRDRQAPASKFAISLSLPRKVKVEIIADTLTQLSDLLANGVALLESLRILSRQSADKRMREVLADVGKAVENGTNLDAAMAQHPSVFTPLTINMVRAGLEGAFLEDSLERIATFLRKQNELRGKVMSAMTYPALLAIVGTIVAVVLMVLVVPMFESFFDRLERGGVGLPVVTLILLAISGTLTRYGIVVGGAVAGLVLLIRKFLSTDRGIRLLDGVKLKVPLAGPIFHDSAVSRFCRVLGTLLANGVPILRSLDISGASAGNSLLRRAIQDSAKNISAGSLLSQPLSASGLVPPQVMAMIRVAEESNTLDRVLVKISDRMDQKIERRLETMVKLIEPIMLLTIGGVVMFIIVGVLLPIIDLNSAID
ncbi:MAG: type II secretion system F family protein [Planctomycetes bacterium]|nr:type II secretion system F family protein [Planctomycetota bacterium]